MLVDGRSSTSTSPASDVQANGDVQDQGALHEPLSVTRIHAGRILPHPASGTQHPRDNQTTQFHRIASGRVETMVMADLLSNPPMEGLRDEPDFDFYIETSWGIWIVIYALCTVCAVSVCIATFTALGGAMARWMLYPDHRRWWSWIFVSLPFTFWCFILFVISLEDIRLQTRQSRIRDWLSRGANSVLIFYFLFQLMTYIIGLPVYEGSLDYYNPLFWLFVVVPVEVYLLLVGFRIRTARGFFIVFLAGGLFLLVLLWPFKAVLSNS